MSLRLYLYKREGLMGFWRCDTCAGGCTISDPNRRWWQFWKTIICPTCKGSGHFQPPRSDKPFPPTSPPPPKVVAPTVIQVRL